MEPVRQGVFRRLRRNLADLLNPAGGARRVRHGRPDQ